MQHQTRRITPAFQRLLGSLAGHLFQVPPHGNGRKPAVVLGPAVGLGNARGLLRGGRGGRRRGGVGDGVFLVV